MKIVQKQINLVKKQTTQKRKLDVDSLKENDKKFIKILNKSLTLKSQERLSSEKHNVFTEQVNKIVLVLTLIKEYNKSIQ